MNKRIKTIITYSLVLVLVVYIAVSLLFPSKTVKIFGFRAFIIVSSSMAPDIEINDMIVITGTNEEKLKAGDVITFKAYIPELNDYSYVTHYIASIELDGLGETIYKTQGANKEIDDFDNWKDNLGNPVDITIDDIEGEYRFTIPFIGALVYRLQDPIFIGLLVLNGTILVIAYKVIRKPNSLKQDKLDEDKIKKEIE